MLQINVRIFLGCLQLMLNHKIGGGKKNIVKSWNVKIFLQIICHLNQNFMTDNLLISCTKDRIFILGSINLHVMDRNILFLLF